MDERDRQRPGRPEVDLGIHGEEITPLGQIIRTLRREKALSITNLASLSGLGKAGRAYISRLEHGKIPDPGASHLRVIAEALGVNGDVLLQYCPPINKTTPS